MKECIHIIVRVDTDTSDIYDHNAICEKLRDLLDNYVDVGKLRDEYINYLDGEENHIVKNIDRIEIL